MEQRATNRVLDLLGSQADLEEATDTKVTSGYQEFAANFSSETRYYQSFFLTRHCIGLQHLINWVPHADSPDLSPCESSIDEIMKHYGADMQAQTHDLHECFKYSIP